MANRDHDKDMDDWERLQMHSHMGKWYSWDSPIGLSIFFLTLAAIVALITLFVQHVI